MVIYINKMNWESKENKRLVKTILSLDSADEARRFLRDLLTENEIKEFAKTYHVWQQNKGDDIYRNIPEYCFSASIEQVRENDYSLVPSRYIKFIDKDSDINFDKEMKRIQKTFKKLIDEEKNSQVALLKAFEDLGYGL